MGGSGAPEALRNLTRPIVESWEPALKLPVETGAGAKTREHKQNDLKRKIEQGARLKRKSSFEESECVAHADLWEHCVKALRGEL